MAGQQQKNADVEQPQAAAAAADQEQTSSEQQQIADNTTTAAASDDNESTANVTSDGAAPQPTSAANASQAAGAAAPDGAATASAQVSTIEHHPILNEFIKLTAELSKNMRQLSRYIIKCHNAYITVQELDASIALSSTRPYCIQLINTMLDLHKSISREVAEGATNDYLEYIRNIVFSYYNLEDIYTARARYNLRHSRRRVTARVTSNQRPVWQRQWQRQRQRYRIY